MAREWIDETYRWFWGWCWLPLALGALVLTAFGGGELLDIAIPTLVPLFFLLYLACPFLCNDDIKYDHAPNRHPRGGGACKVTT